jgi:hypothetical protein
MAIVDINWNPSSRELRQFAAIWIVFFGGFGASSMWLKDSPQTALAFWFVAMFGVLGLAAPGLLRPIYVAWMALVWPIGWVVSHLLLGIVFYLVFTPIGLLMRAVGYDPLTREIDRDAKTYWTPHEEAADSSRYFKQF